MPGPATVPAEGVLRLVLRLGNGLNHFANDVALKGRELQEGFEGFLLDLSSTVVVKLRVLLNRMSHCIAKPQRLRLDL